MAIAEPPPQILDLASACLEYVDRALGFTLDFSSDTLGVVDHYATTVRANLAANPSLGPLIGPAVGAYFGEVVRVRFHGFWRVPPNQHDWAVCLRTVFLNINPIGVGYDALYGSTDHDGPRSALRRCSLRLPSASSRASTLRSRTTEPALRQSSSAQAT